MLKLSNLGFGFKLAITTCLPLALLMYFELSANWTCKPRWTSSTRSRGPWRRSASWSTNINANAAHQRSSWGARGKEFGNELANQRKRTEAERSRATAVLAPLAAQTPDEFKSTIAQAVEAVAALDVKRKEIDALSIGVPASTAYFTGRINSLLALANEMAKVSRNGEVSRAISSYVNFMRAKELAGIERATGAGENVIGQVRRCQLYKRMLSLAAGQDTYFAVRGAATLAQNEFFAQAMSGPVAGDVMKMREIVATGGLTGDMDGFVPRPGLSRDKARSTA